MLGEVLTPKILDLRTKYLIFFLSVKLKLLKRFFCYFQYPPTCQTF